MLLNFCGSLLSWFSPPKTSDRTALQWWQRQQIDRRHGSAEHIRDGALQNLFAIRRTLELAHAQGRSLSDQQLTQMMDQLGALHLHLETISNNLSPPFYPDDFNLAVQYILNQWHREHPKIILTSELTAHSSTPPSHPIGLITLEEWLGVIIPFVSETAAIHVGCQAQADEMILTMAVQEPDGKKRGAIAHTPYLKYLCDSFCLLTGGQVEHVAGPPSDRLCWQFCWPLSPPLPHPLAPVPLNPNEETQL